MILTLHHKVTETPDIITFAFEPDTPCQWQAGQFLEYTLPHQNADERGERRWFTNSAAPHEGQIHITTRFSAPGSTFKRALLAMNPGDTIEATPPEGDFVIGDPSLQYVFIAGGIGITPFRSILVDLHNRGEPLNVTLFYANRSPHGVAFKAELDNLADTHPEMDIHYIYSPAAVTERLVRDTVLSVGEPLFYVSGPEPMVESLGKMLVAMGIPKDHIKQDFFPNYEARL